MPTSHMLSEPVLSARESIARGEGYALESLIGQTPLLRIVRSGDQRAWLKHEGANPGGSFFDRVAYRQLDGLRTGAAVSLVGMNAFAVSAAMLAASRGIRVTVMAYREENRRVHQLLRRYGAEVIMHEGLEEASEACASLTADGSVVRMCRDDKASLLMAYRDVVQEVVRGASVPPTTWVVVDYGVPRDELKSAFRTVSGGHVDVVFVADDRESERILPGRVASRRTQMGHREGLLLGPVGAEVVDRSVEIALSASHGAVCGIVPEGGHRYLGWW